ncbi:tautomerase family protein [Phytomonospora endophytica]|uniref:Phenylpyruvate tautomerase PptA (4-oxalocrotonate tautomerase family) n=1 Tax=Phytomonospora endophytica TaxID=714109 RepID=A0A841FK20_9ACTN|nr:tautomerase family protein [Phytomonospora endophytica]MBB6036224.1 phenylpyruvate tautomerase PptA (4-oxalocrotonate tautomerase family) [Phytomonospora endophytica]GIG67130.1 tautomerase [Phytomonospora endophytica]
MPLVRIDALTTDATRLAALGRAVHDALTETMGFPRDDLFQILTGHDGAGSTMRYGDYLGLHRDEGVVFVGITMRRGRPAERKRALYRRIAELARVYAGTHPRNVVVTINENDAADWSFGDGIAQYAPGEEER